MAMAKVESRGGFRSSARGIVNPDAKNVGEEDNEKTA
jgi:hypothetical protein